jgi:multidrug resistance efflux pump
MLRAVLIFLVLPVIVFADTHYAKLEPLQSITIRSEVNGKVVEAKSALEGKIVDGLIVKIDDKIDKIDLENSKNSLVLLDKMIKVNKNTLPLLKKSFEKKRNLYLKVAPLSSSSVSTKDTLYSAFVSAKSQYSGVLEKILNLKNQKVSLKQKIALLKDRVAKKSVVIKGKYLYALNVKSGEYVNIGAPIATLQDISKAKLTIYLSEDELKDIESKKIYIDGKQSDLKFSKIWRVADSKYISSYKAEIILKPFARFSKLIKVDIK